MDWEHIDDQLLVLAALQNARAKLATLCESFDLNPASSSVIRDLDAAIQLITLQAAWKAETPEEQLNLLVDQVTSFHDFLVRVLGFDVTVEVNLYDHELGPQKCQQLLATAPTVGFGRREWNAQEIGGHWEKGQLGAHVFLYDRGMEHVAPVPEEA